MSAHRAKRIAVLLLVAASLGCGGASRAPSTDTAGATSGAATASAFVPYDPLPPVTAVAPDPATTAGWASTDTGGSTATPANGLGVFSVAMVDAPNPKVDELWVQVESVTAHVVGKGWVKLQGAATPLHVDLLTLKSTATARALGFLNLPAGTITQIRLLIGRDVRDGVGPDLLNFVVLSDGTPVPLKVPSGFETGVKIIGPWTIAACTLTAVTIDFDGHKSIWYHPNGHETEWILRPVIRVRETVTGPITCPDPGSDGTTPPGGTTDGGATGGTTGGATGGGGETPPATKSFGEPCTAPTECTSGSCVLNTCSASSAGTACVHDAECISNLCYQGSCAASSQGGSCTAPSDCTTGVCSGGTCGAGSKLPIGASCNLPAECASNVCSGVGGTCRPGYQGAPCTTSADCDTGLRCVLDVPPTTASCQPASL